MWIFKALLAFLVDASVLEIPSLSCENLTEEIQNIDSVHDASISESVHITVGQSLNILNGLTTFLMDSEVIAIKIDEWCPKTYEKRYSEQRTHTAQSRNDQAG